VPVRCRNLIHAPLRDRSGRRTNGTTLRLLASSPRRFAHLLDAVFEVIQHWLNGEGAWRALYDARGWQRTLTKAWGVANAVLDVTRNDGGPRFESARRLSKQPAQELAVGAALVQRVRTVWLTPRYTLCRSSTSVTKYIGLLAATRV